jgi:hypothetical protein
MKNAKELMARLGCRLEQDSLTEAEFRSAVAEVLAATTDGLSGANYLILSQEIRDLEHAWQDSWERTAN